MNNKLLNTALAVMITTGLSLTANTAMAAAKMDKCYGVAKAGMNDCGGKHTGHACQGQSKKDYDKNDFKMVAAGSCTKIKGGSLIAAWKQEQKENQNQKQKQKQKS